MRFLETLLLVFAAIFVAQLILTAMVVAALLLFLWCLYKRPREAVVLGLGLLLVLFITTPVGLALGVAVALGFGLWALLRRIKTAVASKAEPAGLLGPPKP